MPYLRDLAEWRKRPESNRHYGHDCYVPKIRGRRKDFISISRPSSDCQHDARKVWRGGYTERRPDCAWRRVVADQYPGRPEGPRFLPTDRRAQLLPGIWAGGLPRDHWLCESLDHQWPSERHLQQD